MIPRRLAWMIDWNQGRIQSKSKLWPHGMSVARVLEGSQQMVHLGASCGLAILSLRQAVFEWKL